MADITSVASSNDALANYALKTEETSSGSQLGKDEFLNLMIAQLNNQNPLEPQDNGEFIAQLAQFSSLEQMTNISGSMDNLSSSYRSTQALQASAMVGRSVLVEANTGPTDIDGTISGMVDLPAGTSSLKINIKNGAGEIVRQIDMGQQLAGQIAFQWDGNNGQGVKMPGGDYVIEALASYGGENQQVTTSLSSRVDSVSIAQDGGITLNVANIGSVPLDQVRQIN